MLDPIAFSGPFHLEGGVLTQSHFFASISLVRYKFLYGSFLLNTAAKITLEILNCVQYAAARAPLAVL